jgi:hypothetical protein
MGQLHELHVLTTKFVFSKIASSKFLVLNTHG